MEVMFIPSGNSGLGSARSGRLCLPIEPDCRDDDGVEQQQNK